MTLKRERLDDPPAQGHATPEVPVTITPKPGIARERLEANPMSEPRDSTPPANLSEPEATKHAQSPSDLLPEPPSDPVPIPRAPSLIPLAPDRFGEYAGWAVKGGRKPPFDGSTTCKAFWHGYTGEGTSYLANEFVKQAFYAGKERARIEPGLR